jgi:hypothetical protein
MGSAQLSQVMAAALKCVSSPPAAGKHQPWIAGTPPSTHLCNPFSRHSISFHIYFTHPCNELFLPSLDMLRNILVKAPRPWCVQIIQEMSLDSQIPDPLRTVCGQAVDVSQMSSGCAADEQRTVCGSSVDQVSVQPKLQVRFTFQLMRN